ncbi:MAG: PduL/EutD family phosphate acyltransferase, partial [Bacillota bacterium]|nr:PduL/EutD family phosphate acyltransferase [Bacillota bacterium]
MGDNQLAEDQLKLSQLIKAITSEVCQRLNADQGAEGEKQRWERRIPVGISNRHVHLSQEHLEILFGKDAKLTNFRDLSQPGQFACSETVTIVGLTGVFERVRVLGPTRTHSQVEISASDARRLGLIVPVRDSGDLEGTPGITLVGPVGSITLSQGCIIAARHIHMHP